MHCHSIKKRFMARLAILTTNKDRRDKIFIAVSCLGYLEGEDGYGK
jgi:hypothetical protein